MDKQYKILSIDAWADSEPFSWTWNNWHTVGHLDKLPEKDQDLIQVLVDMGYLNEKALKQCVVSDDQYNLVVEVLKDGCPLYAVEYGSVES